MTKRSIASIFSALAVSTALFAGATPAQAVEPTTLCKPETIFDVFETTRGTTAFGNDGCIYSIINNNPLATKNYDLENGREASQFAREHSNAVNAANRESVRQQQQQTRQQQRCERAQQNVLSRGLDSLIRGRGVNIGDASRAVQECALRR